MKCKYCGWKIEPSIYRKGRFNHVHSGSYCRDNVGRRVLRPTTHATPGYFMDYLEQIEIAETNHLDKL